MKNIFKTLYVLAAGLLIMSSCAQEEAEPLGTSITATPTELVIADSGTDKTGTIEIVSDGIWFATSSNDDWFTYTPSRGNGNGNIVVKTKANVDEYCEVEGPRSGSITIVCGEAMVVVTVKQAGEPGLDASRTYAKVTKAEDLEAGKGYLIVANTGTELIAGKPFAASSDTYYSYIYGDAVTEEEGTIVRPNANNAYTLVTKGEGYAIQQSNGRYLFQAAAYNNFYSTDDATKADEWKITFNEDGAAKIENQTVAGKYFQYSIGYGSYGSYGSAQDGAVLPSLYKDSAAPSDEVLTVAEKTTVKAKVTSVSIPVKSNKTWKVRCHDSWIKTFTDAGTGDGNIEITFDANESYDDVREAKFQIIGETTNFWITLVQDHRYAVLDMTIADFLALDPDPEQLYRVSGKITKIVNSTYGNLYLQDGSGSVYVYTTYENEDKVAKSFGNLGVKVGDILTLVGVRARYEKASVEDQKDQLSGAYCEKAFKPADTTVDQMIAAPVASTYLESTYYKVEGVVKSIVSDTYGNFYLKSLTTDKYIYVYGLTNAPCAKNNKSFKSLGIKAGDVVTLVGQRGQYANASTADQKEQVANAYYISHLTMDQGDTAEYLFLKAGYKLADYTRKAITWTHNGYYNSTGGTSITTGANNSTQFACTPIYHRGNLPVGTVLVIGPGSPGWMYRPEGWSNLSTKTASGNRPKNITGNSNPITVINADWFDKAPTDAGTSSAKFNFRAFNIARVGNPALTEAQQAELEGVFAIYIPKAQETTDAIIKAKGYDPANYTKLEFNCTKKAFWNSTDNTNHSTLITSGSNVTQFVATTIIEKAQIPNGSLIVIKSGYQYRPDGWQTFGQKNSATRPGNVSTDVVVVDDAWWGNFTCRGFNLALLNNPNLPDSAFDDVIGGFAIYVPKN